jgi:hypothetical protein
MKKCSLLDYTLARKFAIAVPSVIHVNMSNRVRIANKPGNQRRSPVDLRGAEKLFQGFEQD